MSDQEKAGRLMTFEEFAPQCVVAANRWIENHPQGSDKDWNDPFALITTLRSCIQRGIDKRNQEQQKPLTCEGCANLPNKYGYGVTMNAPCRICIRGIKTSDYYKPATEPKGDAKT